MPRVLLYCPDLFHSTRVMSLVQRAGVDCEAVATLQQLTPTVEQAEVIAVVIDLQAAGRLTDLAPLAEAVPLIGFGPHVQTDRLRDARQAGFAHVLTHSQLDERLPELLKSQAGRDLPSESAS